MQALAELVRYRALEQHATEMSARAAVAVGANRDEALREALAARARMLELETTAR